jgi:hypothetical protein
MATLRRARQPLCVLAIVAVVAVLPLVGPAFALLLRVADWYASP